MVCEPSGPFITSVLELKLDTTTMFEWQKHSQDTSSISHYKDLLEFINLRVQAPETSMMESKRLSKSETKVNIHNHKQYHRLLLQSILQKYKHVYCANQNDICYLTVPNLFHKEKMSVIKGNNYCNNCLRSVHYCRQCKSVHCCKKCHGQHHTLLHI
jgi:hypothetical protein